MQKERVCEAGSKRSVNRPDLKAIHKVPFVCFTLYRNIYVS